MSVIRVLCAVRTGCAPLSPFLPTMAKQRGYSAFVVGLIFSLQSIPGLMAKVIFGMLTDKYNCRRSVFISTTVVTLLLVGAMLSIPGKDGAGKIDDSDVVGSPLFWLFCVSVSMFTATTMVKGVLTDTICMGLLGKSPLPLRPLLFRSEVPKLWAKLFL